jgi:glycine/D-amino acid oxidase-like deaminating enzyme
VVVGGGIIGCATAFELSRRGARVILIERAELAAGASGRNHGLLLTPLDPVLVPMAEHSTRLYRDVVAESVLPVAFDERPIGFVIASGADQEERNAARAEAEAARGSGVAVERLTGDQARGLEPGLAPDVEEAWLLHDGLRLDPAALTVALALRARELGATVERNLTVRAVRVEHNRARGVVTDDGVVDADAVVVAAGPWTAPLLRRLGVDLPIVGFRGWLIHLRPAGASPVQRLVGRAGWHTLPDVEPATPVRARDVMEPPPVELPGTLLQPNPDRTVLVGGSRQAALANEPEDPSIPRRILEQGARLVPALADADVLSAWWGIRPITPDGRPAVGTVAPGVIVAAGHGGQGVILGGGTAALVASMASGAEAPFDASPFDLSRFGPPTG